MARVAIWYNGKIVDDNPHNPKYVGGKFKMFDVGESIAVSEFFESVREKCGIGSSIRITINYRLFLSSTSAALVDIAGCDTLSDFLSGSEIHAFYVQKDCAPAEEPNTREIIERTSAGSKEPYPRGTVERTSTDSQDSRVPVQGSCSAHVVRDQPNLNLLKTRSSTTVQTRATRRQEQAPSGLARETVVADVADSSRSSPHHSFDNVIDGSSDSSSLDDEQHNEPLLISSWDGGQDEMESPTDNPTCPNTQASGRHRSISKPDVGGSRFTSADLSAPIPTSSTLYNEFFVGQIFETKQKLKFALHDTAVMSRRELRVYKSDHQSLEWKCGAKGCGWCIRGNKIGELPSFRITRYLKPHTCKPQEGQWDPKQASVDWIAAKEKEMLKIQPDLSTKEIVTNIETRFGIKVSRSKSKRAMASAKESLHGNYKDSFDNLRGLEREFTSKGDGTVTNLIVNDDGTFRSFFWAFGPCIEAFNICLRPVMIMDSTILTGVYSAVLLIACGVDGENEIVPIAFSVVEEENDDGWGFFVQCVQNLVLGPSRKELTVITDMKESIVTSIKQFLPVAHHSFCLQHLTENFVSKCHERILEDLVWRCGTAFTGKECDYYLEHLRRGNTQASDWLEAVDKSLWTTSYFSGCRYDIYTTKLTESFKAIIGDVLDLPITGLVLGTRTKVADYLCKRQQDVSDIANGLTKHYARLLETSQLESNIYNVTHFSLHESRVYIQDQEFSVNLDGRTCSCRQYQLMGMPCVHAIAAIQARHYNIHDYCVYWYTIETYRQTYSKTLSTIRSCNDWTCDPNDSPILPPTWRKRVGRPKRKSIESQSLVHGGTIRCGKCKEPGHNRLKCGVKSA
ncbi:hypothetical protein MKX03_007986 [Papaver bracteatum]|nr:hypothetical protein MKX03_007986 [Papaver bracteatum]